MADKKIKVDIEKGYTPPGKPAVPPKKPIRRDSGYTPPPPPKQNS